MKRRHSTLGYTGSVQFEEDQIVKVGVNASGSSPESAFFVHGVRSYMYFEP